MSKNLKQIIAKIKQYLNQSQTKAIICICLSAIIFGLSLFSPIIASLGILGQIILPISAIGTTIFAGFDYFENSFFKLKDAFIKIKANFKKSRSKIAFVKQELAKTLNMSMLISLSCLSSILYGLFLFSVAPVALYASPLFFLGALYLSKVLKSNIKTLDKEIEAKINRLSEEKNYYDSKYHTEGTDYVIKPGEILPVDCILLSIEALIQDNEIISGEKEQIKPVKYGDKLYAGTKYVGDREINVKASCDSEQSVHYKRIQAILEKPEQESEFGHTINKISQYFIPCVLAIALISLLAWSVVSGFSLGFCVMMDVFFAACPCVLGMANNLPFAVLKKILFNFDISIYQDTAIEKLTDFDTVVFDKTGTLTTITLKNQDVNDKVVLDDRLKGKILSAIAKAERYRLTKKPTDSFAGAIINSNIFNDIPHDYDEYFVERDLDNGMGVSFNFRDSKNQDKTITLYIGNLDFLFEQGICVTSEFSRSQADKDQYVHTYVGIKIDDEPGFCYSRFNFNQELRPEAKQTIDQLKAKNIDIHMLTGDVESSAFTVANSLGINLNNVKAGCRPTDKKKYVNDLIEGKKETKDKKRKVVFVGDGMNDFEVAKYTKAVCIAIGKNSNMNGIFATTINKLTDLLSLKNACKKTILYRSILFLFAIITNSIAIVLAAIVFPIFNMVTMMGCLGACMAGLTFGATIIVSFLAPTIKEIFESNAHQKYQPKRHPEKPPAVFENIVNVALPRSAPQHSQHNISRAPLSSTNTSQVSISPELGPVSDHATRPICIGI